MRRSASRRRPVKSRGIKPYIFPDQIENPLDDGPGFGTALMSAYGRHIGPKNAVNWYYAPEYANSSCDPFKFRDLWSYVGENEAVEYLRKHGVLVSEIPGGWLLAGHAEIMREYGYDNGKSRSLAQNLLDDEARLYEQWVDGEVYGYTIRDIPDAPNDPEIGYVWEYDTIEGEELETVGGFIGEKWAEEAAKEAYAAHAAVCSRSRRKKSCRNCGSERCRR